jgi:hypothetical protein
VVDGYARFAGEEYSLNQKYRADGMSRVTVEMALAGVERVLARSRGDGR